MPCPASTGLLFESWSQKTHHVECMAMAISKWVHLFRVVSIAAGLSGVANRSSVSADVAGALFAVRVPFVRFSLRRVFGTHCS